MAIKVESKDLATELKLPIVLLTHLKGDDTVEHVLLKGGQHPRMRFVDDAAHCLSYSATIIFLTTDPIISLLKGAGRIVAAITAGGSAASGFKERWTRTAAGAGKNEEEMAVFEPEDDVVVQITSGGNAATFNLVQLHFEQID